MSTNQPSGDTHIVPSWVKVVIGVTVAALIAYTLPIFDLMMAFLYFCVLPMVFVGCIAMAVFGLHEWFYSSFEKTWNSGVDSLRDRIIEKAAEMKSAS